MISKLSLIKLKNYTPDVLPGVVFNTGGSNELDSLATRRGYRFYSKVNKDMLIDFKNQTFTFFVSFIDLKSLNASGSILSNDLAYSDLGDCNILITNSNPTAMKDLKYNTIILSTNFGGQKAYQFQFNNKDTVQIAGILFFHHKINHRDEVIINNNLY